MRYTLIAIGFVVLIWLPIATAILIYERRRLVRRLSKKPKLSAEQIRARLEQAVDKAPIQLKGEKPS